LTKQNRTADQGAATKKAKKGKLEWYSPPVLLLSSAISAFGVGSFPFYSLHCFSALEGLTNGIAKLNAAANVGTGHETKVKSWCARGMVTL
jgi:hypothetical protein